MPDAEGFPTQKTLGVSQGARPGDAAVLDALYEYLQALYSAQADIVEATITAGDGTGLSDAVALGTASAIALQMPASWDAAALTFQTSLDDGATWQNAYDKDGEITYSTDAVAASRNIHLDPLRFGGATHLKIRSGTSATPVTQTTTDRIIGVSVRRFH